MLAGFILMAQMATPSLTYRQAKAQADADENSLPAVVHVHLLESQDKVLKAAVAECARPHPNLSPFTVVLSLHADGSVAASWLQGRTPFARCVRTQLVASGVPGHWPAAFHTSFEVSFHGQ